MNNNNWICTDIDNQQFGRQLSPTIFEFKENSRGLFGYDGGEFVELEINLDKYSSKEIENHISAYYSNVAQIVKEYKESANWIIAECIFEQESGLY